LWPGFETQEGRGRRGGEKGGWEGRGGRMRTKREQGLYSVFHKVGIKQKNIKGDKDRYFIMPKGKIHIRYNSYEYSCKKAKYQHL
jgi:hypothetical protein